MEDSTINVEKKVYTVKEVQQILGIGKNQAYELVHSNVFPVVMIGNSPRIPIKTFDEWVYSGGKISNNQDKVRRISLSKYFISREFLFREMHKVAVGTRT